jgi:hypothetical protein
LQNLVLEKSVVDALSKTPNADIFEQVIVAYLM